MGCVVWLLLQRRPAPGTGKTLLIVAIGMLVYAVLLLLGGAISEEELRTLSGGKHLVRLLNKLGILRKGGVEE